MWGFVINRIRSLAGLPDPGAYSSPVMFTSCFRLEGNFVQGQPRSQHGPNKAESSNCALPEGLLVFLSFALISLSLSLSLSVFLSLSSSFSSYILYSCTGQELYKSFLSDQQFVDQRLEAIAKENGIGPKKLARCMKRGVAALSNLCVQTCVFVAVT